MLNGRYGLRYTEWQWDPSSVCYQMILRTVEADEY
jgi:hypothetical protein